MTLPGAPPTDDAAFQREARLFGTYLLGGPADAAVVRRYQQAMQLRPIPLDPADSRILAFVLRHPGCLGPIDGALALSRPQSGMRKRLLIMIAILEARPQDTELFLPGGGSLSEAISAALRGGLRSALGLILLRFI